MRRSVVFALAFASTLLMIAAVATAVPWYPPYETNADCLECHAVGSSYGYSPVDFGARSSAMQPTTCGKCHNYIWTNVSRHYHFIGGCGDGTDECHYLSVTNSELKLPRFLSPFGWFNSAGSLNVGAAEIHRIHVNESWVMSERDFIMVRGACRPCHGAISCGTCHAAPAHGGHAVSDYPAVTYMQSDGRKVFSAASTCVNPSCHALATAGTAYFTPNCTTCHPEAVGFHGYDAADHAAVDSQIEGVGCSACHSLDLATEHDKVSASSAGEQCRTCHLGTVDAARPWAAGCVAGDCHTETSSAPFHANADAAHEAPADRCYGCHDGSDLPTVHSSAAPEEGRYSCLVCHTPQ